MPLSSLFGKGEPETSRVVHANSPHLNEKFPNNKISNTKYTVLTFIPLNLYEQFRRFMNLYFLLIGFLQLWSVITPVNPLSTWGAIGFIFALSASKEAIDDYRRYIRDKKANTRPYQILRNGKKQQVASEDISVGDILYLEDNSEVPCDVVILCSSDNNGLCYVQTANLDGETDYKQRRAPTATMGMTIDQLSNFTGVVECAAPNAEIYRFDSRMRINSGESYSSEWITLSASNTLLQATHLRNTSYIYGLVVYTGNETKIGKNKQLPPSKWTKLDRSINRITMFIFTFQLSLVVIFGAIGESLRLRYGNDYWYLGYPEELFPQWYSWMIIPLRFLLLNSTMIPISLKVTMDVIKYAYSMIIEWDIQMYHEPSDTPTTCNNTAISEDMGQVEYLFTDKTGTLTENIMLFKRCYINGAVYSGDFDGTFISP